jgi:hypothetical protein
MRVHAWKPDTDSNISLVSGARMMLHGENGSELDLPVHFAAQKGVLYALYGYLSEDSDVLAQDLRVIIDEPEDTGETAPEPPRSIFAMDRGREEARPANALLHYGSISIERPVSQSCTVQQIGRHGLNSDSADATLSRWSETVSLAALSAYLTAYAGLEGLVVGPTTSNFTQQLDLTASLTRRDHGAPPSRMDMDFYDILLMPTGMGPSGDSYEARERWEAAEDWLARLKVGGLAALCLRYQPSADLVSSTATAQADVVLTQNEIGQWALRLIGKGYSVAPLAFAAASELAVDSQGLAGFIMIVQRL